MTERYVLRPTDTAEQQQRAQTVTKGFLHAIQDAGDEFDCSPAEMIAGTAYALASLIEAAKFEGARDIAMRVLEVFGTPSSAAEQ